MHVPGSGSSYAFAPFRHAIITAVLFLTDVAPASKLASSFCQRPLLLCGRRTVRQSDDETRLSHIATKGQRRITCKKTAGTLLSLTSIRLTRLVRLPSSSFWYLFVPTPSSLSSLSRRLPESLAHLLQTIRIQIRLQLRL
jgi:hypothetical protein